MTTLRKLQLAELEILKEVDRVCRAHGITYFLTGGTLLGAVRHEGFIPWDDDIDIGMLRADYLRFRQAAPAAFGDRFFLQDSATDAGYPMPHAKVRKNGTVMRQAGAPADEAHTGIFIDIFPVDNLAKPGGIPLRLRASLIQKISYVILWNRYYAEKPEHAPHGLKKGVLALTNFLFSDARQKKIREWLMTRCGDDASAYCVIFETPYGYQREVMRRADFVPVRMFRFEGGAYPGPANPQRYLTNLFGPDYMTPPPEEERGSTHDLTEISFE